MRAMWIAAGFGVLAVGMVLGLVMSGVTSNAEAAPKNQQPSEAGRLISLGTHSVGVNPAQVALPMEDVSDCRKLLMAVSLSAAGESGFQRLWRRVSGG